MFAGVKGVGDVLAGRGAGSSRVLLGVNGVGDVLAGRGAGCLRVLHGVKGVGDVLAGVEQVLTCSSLV